MIALYTRVSTQEQANEGYSIKEQEERLKKYCELMDWKPCKVYADPAYSGANMERPSLQELIHDVEHGKISKVIVLKLDRLSRSQLDTLFLIEKVFNANNCDFISITENFDTSTPFGKAMMGMLAVFAQLEREQIKERMSIGREARIKEGKWYGGGYTAIGYDYRDGHLVINPYEAMQIREIFDSFLHGKRPYELERIFGKKGYSHKYGKWTGHRIKSVLQNDIYIGNLKLNNESVQGNHEPIIDEETFEKAQILLSQQRQSHAKQQSTYLGGLLFCAKCGARYGVMQAGRNGHRHKYYVCYSKSKSKPSMVRDPDCDNKNYPIHKLDEMIFGEIRKLKLDPAMMQEEPDTPQDHTEIIRKELDKIDAQRNRLLNLYSLGTIEAEELESLLNPLTEKKKGLLDTMESLAITASQKAEKHDIIQSFDDLLNSGDFHLIRSAIDILIEKIVIDGEDISIYWNF